jgi:hypothetical protein
MIAVGETGGSLSDGYGKVDRVNATKDWYDWHRPYADGASPLAWRLRLIQGHIRSWLDERPDEPLTVVSACAGQGRDLLEVLAAQPDAGRVHSYLLENDERNVAVAQAAVQAGGIPNVTLRRADAGDLAAYAGAVPADLVLLAGALGNISDSHIPRTISALPRLCASGATVIWTRTRRAPDLTPAVRSWFRAAGFVEQVFHAPDGVLFSVGVHRFVGGPQPLVPAGELFQFIR